MRVLVTGAAGMLGSDVCDALAGEHKVVAADIVGNCDWLRVAACETLDITHTRQTFDVIGRAKPELVVHCAAFTDVDGCERDPDKAYRVNALGSWNVAAASEQVGAAILYIGTDFVFDGEKDGHYDEFDTPNPLSHYGRSKWAGEQLVREACRKHFIIRTAWMYGERGKNFVTTILNAAAEGKHLRVVSDQIGSPTYSKDLARVIVSLAGSPLYGVYHATNSGSCSWYELAVKAVQFAGLKGVYVTPIPTSEWPTPTRRPKRSVLRHLALEMQGRDDLRPWDEALSEFVERWTTARQ
ncbi:MAG: dTDP-4-dehydrorhamnose reductase [Armatimonadota bacterium]|nr:dTDP-4-dehydrorhamnose reductase [Armatimonadota bacterium]